MDVRSVAQLVPTAAVVWLDRWHARVVRSRPGTPMITEVDRASDPEAAYLFRIARAAADCDRVVILGPDASRLAFEREYVALYKRPDRLLEVGVAPALHDDELLDRLRFIASSPTPAR